MAVSIQPPDPSVPTAPGMVRRSVQAGQPTAGSVSMVTVRYFAGARAAAGIAEEPVSAVSVRQLLDSVQARHGDRLAAVLSSASLLVDGLVCHDRDAVVDHGAIVDVLPPFAGG